MEYVALVYVILTLFSLILTGYHVIRNIFRKSTTYNVLTVNTLWIAELIIAGFAFSALIGGYGSINLFILGISLWCSWRDFKVWLRYLEVKDQLQTDAD